MPPRPAVAIGWTKSAVPFAASSLLPSPPFLLLHFSSLSLWGSVPHLATSDAPSERRQDLVRHWGWVTSLVLVLCSLKLPGNSGGSHGGAQHSNSILSSLSPRHAGGEMWLLRGSSPERSGAVRLLTWELGPKAWANSGSARSPSSGMLPRDRPELWPHVQTRTGLCACMAAPLSVTGHILQGMATARRQWTIQFLWPHFQNACGTVWRFF